jgi:hypothetical protein
MQTDAQILIYSVASTTDAGERHGAATGHLSNKLLRQLHYCLQHRHVFDESMGLTEHIDAMPQRLAEMLLRVDCPDQAGW